MADQIQQQQYSETRYLIIYGYTRNELSKVLTRFEAHLPQNISMSLNCKQEFAKITLSGTDKSLELLRFNLNIFSNNNLQHLPKKVRIHARQNYL